MEPVTQVQVSLNQMPSLDELRKQWLALEDRSNNQNIFLSWAWIHTWLKTYQAQCRLLVIDRGSECIGLALLVATEQKRHGCLRSRVWRLHQTGVEAQDQIWTEYNGLLCALENREQASAAAMDYLLQAEDWDEFWTGAADEYLIAGLNKSELHCHEMARLPTYQVDLKTIRASGKSYLEQVSRNLRYQVRHAGKLYAAEGELSFEIAGSAGEASDFFNAIKPLHIERWGGGNNGSGFVNEEFTRFHLSLITDYWHTGLIQLCRLSVGGQPLAFLYNFVYGRQVFFYLSGVKKESSSKLKPGLLCHSLCIQDNLEKGFDTYDLMGGDMEYKRRLATRGEDLVLASLQRPRLKLKAEQWLRQCKTALSDFTTQGL